MKNLIAIPLLCGLLLGCDNKAEISQIETASKDALRAPDPFQALDKFDEQTGRYGRYCGQFLGDVLSYISSNQRAVCEKLLATQTKIVVSAVDKGSLPALLFLLDSRQKNPPVYLKDLPADYAIRQTAHLYELASSLPTTKENAELFSRAAMELQTGYSVMQDSEAAINLYKKAWQAGDQSAAVFLSDIYAFLGETRQAYFWSIRAHSFTNNANKLTRDEKIDIQRKAADATITDI
ncbi:TPA: hypothetical protein MCW43_005325 [Klebsiella pneumoniae]|nr:hypothetical protein [Klebsiella pneumoniae]